MKRADMEALIAAADALAERSLSVFQSEYHNTNHIEGAREYYLRNLEVLAAYRAARDAARPVPPAFSTSA